MNWAGFVTRMRARKLFGFGALGTVKIRQLGIIQHLVKVFTLPKDDIVVTDLQMFDMR